MSSEHREVLPIMLGTAGHVDHGKTSLVRRLTSWETDTHKEEIERGVSIDFGVAPFLIDQEYVTGIIDVPGHIDYIRNMVAGASAVDLLMLVVAADDGVMPQTREHMQIASLLGVTRLIVVLTKCDLVDSETAELAELEIAEFLATLGYENIPVYRVSSETGEGIAELRTSLVSAVHQTLLPEEEKPFRMFVRKAFTMKGFGTVVTGVPLSGRAEVGGSLKLIPGDIDVSIRTIHNYRSVVDAARSHVSCALNVRDIAPDQFVRGMALVHPGSYQAMRSILAYFTNVSDRDIKQEKKDRIVRLHVGTAAIPVRLTGRVGAGGEGFLELHSFKPVVITTGDRFVLRELSTSTTIGGGQVLACSPESKISMLHPQRNERTRAALQAEDTFLAFFWSSQTPMFSVQSAAKYLQLPTDQVEQELKVRAAKSQIVSLHEDVWLFRERSNELVEAIEAILKRYHRSNPEAFGIKDQHLCQLLSLPRNALGRLWQEIQKSGLFVYENSFLSLTAFAPTVSKQERAQETQLMKLLAQSTGQLAAKGTILSELGLVEKDYRKLIKRLGDSQRVVALGNSVISAEVITNAENVMLTLFEKAPVLDLAEFRQVTGLSRNVAVEILEHFDSKGLTKRLSAGRVLARKV